MSKAEKEWPRVGKKVMGTGATSGFLPISPLSFLVGSCQWASENFLPSFLPPLFYPFLSFITVPSYPPLSLKFLKTFSFTSLVGHLQGESWWAIQHKFATPSQQAGKPGGGMNDKGMQSGVMHGSVLEVPSGLGRVWRCALEMLCMSEECVSR